ncbi:MAG: hypothetical protein MJ175_00840 [Clostridia bacterium]|nr:hypothetical protein [Clostridia bacterium]
MNEYLNPHVTAVGRLPARARRFAEKTVSLGGTWSFCLFARPEDCGDFYSDGIDESAYRPITVPGNWQLQGFGKPIYTNYAYPWPIDGEYGVDNWPDPWKVPKENPTGCYRRRFTLPDNTCGNDVILRFDGVETAYEVYINGTLVGYAEDSKLTSEFDVTAYVHEGENLLALRVFTFATSSYLEDQDYWYLCGIHRAADLILVPHARIEDFKIDAVADRYTPGGTLSADIRVSRTPGYSARSIRASLKNPDGVLLSAVTEPIRGHAEYNLAWAPTTAAARIRMTLPEVERWSPDTPILYTLYIEYLDTDGTVLDTESSRVGFKRVAIEDGILLINGRRALIFGVNRHECAWKEGRAVSREHMVREIESMKRMNVNAVRTCHYPDSPLWYDLCDEMGILVLCECDIETHGVSGQISHDGDFVSVYTERAQRMVYQHKNHACIYGWSLGNQSGCGPNHAAKYSFIKEYDKTRICQYEAGDPGKNISDIRGKMYATEKEILSMLTNPRDNRPVILVEYLYQIRNSGGRMEKFIEMLRRYERFQGGFVWDWQDKSLPLPLPDGTFGFGHGGDFDEPFKEPSEPPYMTNNGLVRADLVWKPVAYEVREAYAPLLIDSEFSDSAWMPLYGTGLFRAFNRSSARSSEDFTVTLTVKGHDGLTLAHVPVSLPVLAPGASCEVPRFYDLEEKFADEPILFYEFAVEDKRGETVSCRQFRVRDGLIPSSVCRPACAPVSTATEKTMIFEASGAKAVFSRDDGMLLSYEKDGKLLITSSALCKDRPYCGLDAQPGWGMRPAMDEARNLPLCFAAPTVSAKADSLTMTAVFRGGFRLAGDIAWTMYGDGTLLCELHLRTTAGLILPRFGVELTVPGDLDTADYTGYGPMENYADRMVAPRFGSYIQKVEDLGFDFAPPSENGGHEGTIRLALRSADSEITFDSDHPFHFDAHPYTVKDCQKALHTHELPTRDEITVHLDAYHAPIGGDMAWSTMLSKEDIPGAKDHTLRFLVK